MGSSNTSIPDNNTPLTQAQAQQYVGELTNNLNAQYQQTLNDMLKSGNYLKQDDSGLLRVAGGRNRYGEVRPDYVLMQEEPGKLANQFTESLQSGYQTLLDKGMTQGDTEAAKLARQQQSMMNQQSLDQLNTQANTASVGAMGNIAQRGGLRSGAAERIGMNTANALMNARQGQNAANQMADLNISMQDEAMKNQLLGTAGQAQQVVQSGNINRLQQDIQNQNLQQYGLYSEDMKAFAAQQSANAQASANSCFTGDMKVSLVDGSLKRLDELDLGDMTLRGGKVLAMQKSYADKIYNYKGVMVTGSHAVFHDNKWVRVRDTDAQFEMLDEPVIVYCPITENHRLVVDQLIFADLEEVNDGSNRSEEECIRMLNEGC